MESGAYGSGLGGCGIEEEKDDDVFDLGCLLVGGWEVIKGGGALWMGEELWV